MSNAEFREHIRRIVGAPEATARRAHPCVVRTPTDKGFSRPEQNNQQKKEPTK